MRIWKKNKSFFIPTQKNETTDASQLQSSMRNEYFWKKTKIEYIKFAQSPMTNICFPRASKCKKLALVGSADRDGFVPLLGRQRRRQPRAACSGCTPGRRPARGLPGGAGHAGVCRRPRPRLKPGPGVTGRGGALAIWRDLKKKAAGIGGSSREGAGGEYEAAVQ